MSNKKIRPSRIIDGWTKVIKGEEQEFSANRMSVCDTCPSKKVGMCIECGCPLMAKTKVIEEYCPLNKWSDVKHFEEEGITLVNLSTDKGVLSISKDGFQFVYHPLVEDDDSLLTFKIVNESDKKWEKISLKATCSCTLAEGLPSKLKNEDDTDFTVKYDTTIIGAFHKSLKLRSNGELLCLIRISGVVKRKDGKL